MIEPVMYFAIGFLVAALLGLLFVPLVHNRAVRLTMRRLEAATPLSVAEIRADKDQLRAEFAMSTRRLEMSVEQMKTKTTTQLAELGKKTDAINLLKKELGEKATAVFALEANEKSLREKLGGTEEDFERQSNSLREAERALSNKEAELVRLVAELGERSVTADGQRIELAALRTQIEAMKVSVGDYERTVKETELRLNRHRDDADAATTDLTDVRGKFDSMSSRREILERQLQVQTTEADMLSRRVREMESQLSEQGRQLAEREYELNQYRAERESLRRGGTDMPVGLANFDGSLATADKYRSDIIQLEAQLAAAIEDRARLQRELATLKRDAESSWASERVENALLRERINDVAAEVARLTATLEGPESPIEAMLAADDAPTMNGGKGSATAVNGSGDEADSGRIDSPRNSNGSLADRIRALQATASRVASSN